MQKAASCWFAGFCKTKPTCSHVFKQMIREWALMNESSKHPRAYVLVMEGLHARRVITGSRIAEGPARSRRARWKHGLYSAKARADQKRAHELLIQSREFLEQMQAG